MLLIGLGITSLAMTRGAEGVREPRMVAFSLATGGFVATYTLLDGLGARVLPVPLKRTWSGYR